MKTIRQLVTILVILACAIPAAASRLETVKVESESMHKQIDVSVVLPDSYGARPLPVVYLLHGYGDNNLLGYLSYTNVRQYADMFDVVLVIPDGGTNWYFDSPVDPTIRYETFVSSELIKYIDKNYLTDARRERRAVTGLSMGGHGALYLAIRHQDVFAYTHLRSHEPLRPLLSPQHRDKKKWWGAGGRVFTLGRAQAR